MSLFDYAKAKLGLVDNHKKFPLGLHPGTQIEIKETPVIFAETDGSVIKDIKRSAKIETTGYYQMGDTIVFRAYFDDGYCFIEVTVKETAPETPISLRLFKMMNEDTPYPELKRFLLTGRDPLIGCYQFGLDDNKIVYDRVWKSGTNAAKFVQPVNLVESIMDETKNIIQHDDHHFMLYQRSLPNMKEYLYADYIFQERFDGQKAEMFYTFAGIDISVNDINIYAS